MHLDQHPVFQRVWNLVARKVYSVVTMQLPADACQRWSRLCTCSSVLSTELLHPDNIAYCVVLSLYCESGCVRYLGVFLVRDPANDSVGIIFTAT